MRILVTGGCGFIGAHFVEHTLKNTDWHVVVLDKLNYASKGFDRLRDINVYDDKRITRLAADFTKPIIDGLAYEIGDVDYIIHMGAYTHVENSIKDPRPFVYSNVVGTMEMLEFARSQKYNLKAFVYFSTDEVFGPASIKWEYRSYNPDRPLNSQLIHHTRYMEWDRYNSTNPYSATKAAGEELCLAYANTYAIPVIITHSVNAFGERQHPEKFIPMVIRKTLAGEMVQIHADANREKPGSRFWIHARNVAAAVLFLILHVEAKRDKFNIVGEREVDNLHMALTIASILNRQLEYELVDFHSSRPGHDLRYALDGSKMEAQGWKLPVDFMESLIKTVNWYVKNPKWLYPYWGNERSENGLQR